MRVPLVWVALLCCFYAMKTNGWLLAGRQGIRSLEWHKWRERHDSRVHSATVVDLSLEDTEDRPRRSSASTSTRNDHEWMFNDVAKINCKGGDGGDGCKAMRREYCVEFGGPVGGNGGHGGNVYLQCDRNLNTLSSLHRKVHYVGGDGTNGRGSSRHGHHGEHSIVRVPPGTVVRDATGALAGELTRHGDSMLVARGGRGGYGNEHFQTARRTAPSFAENGQPGIERWLSLELKLLADVGLIGVPNAGKSTLLAAVTNARPKIADYPFTTVVPNLGVCDLMPPHYQQPSHQQQPPLQSQPESRLPTSTSTQRLESLVVADIPGLLEGAHEGAGLGTAFLRHIQRCRVLIHVVSANSIDPVGDFHAINQELRLFNPQLAEKPQVVAINKIDLVDDQSTLLELIDSLRRAAGHSRLLSISALRRQNVRELMQRVARLVDSLPAVDATHLLSNDERFVDLSAMSTDGDADLHGPNTPSFEIIQLDERQFRVFGRKIEELVTMTKWEYYEAVVRFQRILDATGINAALLKAGAKQGDEVHIGNQAFNFVEPKNKWMMELGFEDN